MIKKVQLKIVLFTIMGVFFTFSAFAQSIPKKERRAIARQAIQNLKGGTLVLRLKSKHNKITKLEELLAAPDIKESVKIKLSKNLETTIDERNQFNLSLTNAFEEYFSFSNIYYMYDTSSIALKNGQRSGFFLNKNLELDPSIEIPEGEFFVIKIGTTDASTTTGVEAMVIMDKNLKDMMPPFPYYVRINSISRLFTRIFNHKNLVRKDSEKIVQKLETNFRRFGN